MDFGGVKREARIDLMPDVKPGEYVLIHTGFIIERVDEETAKEILNAWEEVFKVEPTLWAATTIRVIEYERC